MRQITSFLSLFQIHSDFIEIELFAPDAREKKGLRREKAWVDVYIYIYLFGASFSWVI